MGAQPREGGTRRRREGRARLARTAASVGERGSAPTVGQLRDLAGKYHFPLAVFYLPEPPLDFTPLRDFRRLPNVEAEPISANLAYHIRSAYNRRELGLELYEELNSAPNRFLLTASLDDDPEQVGRAIRSFSRLMPRASSSLAEARMSASGGSRTGNGRSSASARSPRPPGRSQMSSAQRRHCAQGKGQAVQGGTGGARRAAARRRSIRPSDGRRSAVQNILQKSANSA